MAGDLRLLRAWGPGADGGDRGGQTLQAASGHNQTPEGVSIQATNPEAAQGQQVPVKEEPKTETTEGQKEKSDPKGRKGGVSEGENLHGGEKKNAGCGSLNKRWH